MSGRDPESDAIFRDIAAAYRGSPAFELKRMFGSDALLVDGRLACFGSRTGALVVKLTDSTADRLRAAGDASPMLMRGRPMGAWLAVRRSPELDWFALADEAVHHVRALHAGS